MQELEIFKPGRHTAMSGVTLEFTEADLKASAAAYDPAIHEAPMVVGHPQADAPAYGWIRGLEYAEKRLRARATQVDPQFAELVAAGRFKKMSASFYRPEAPNNPKPGVYYLRHVGFLGAQPPAVKGLKSAEFSEEEGVIEFGDYDDRLNAGLWRKLREWLIAKFGVEEADNVIPGPDVSAIEASANEPSPEGECPAGEGAAPGYAEAKNEKEEEMKKEEELKARETAVAGREAAFAEREASIRKKEGEMRRGEHLAFADALIKEGRLLPVLKERAVAILDFAAASESGAVEFCEGDEKKTMPAAEAIKELLKSFPKAVEFGEAAPGTGKEIGVTEDYGGAVDEDRLVTHKKALSYAEEHKLPYAEALTAVIKNEKEGE